MHTALTEGIVAHEAIHGIIWAAFAKRGFRSIRFGFLRKKLTPYCHCSEPLEVRLYIAWAIMPSIVLGLLPAPGGSLTGHTGLLVYDTFFTMAAGGNFLIIYRPRGETLRHLGEGAPSGSRLLFRQS